ncbi:MAG TPA: PqqD family protein [bacterium]|nr:PqqD family protein [bacterium]
MITVLRFTVNTPTVVHEVFDDEVVIINLDTGVYYSVNGLAAEIWTRIDGATAGGIIDDLASQYAMAASDVEASVRPFLDELSAEGLIVPEQPGSRERGRDAAPGAITVAPRVPQFETPVLRKYNDMQELLLLDPIHEVDEVGWPVRPLGVPEQRPKDRA